MTEIPYIILAIITFYFSYKYFQKVKFWSGSIKEVWGNCMKVWKQNERIQIFRELQQLTLNIQYTHETEAIAKEFIQRFGKEIDFILEQYQKGTLQEKLICLDLLTIQYSIQKEELPTALNQFEETVPTEELKRLKEDPIHDILESDKVRDLIKLRRKLCIN